MTVSRHKRKETLKLLQVSATLLV